MAEEHIGPKNVPSDHSVVHSQSAHPHPKGRQRAVPSVSSTFPPKRSRTASQLAVPRDKCRMVAAGATGLAHASGIRILRPGECTCRRSLTPNPGQRPPAHAGAKPTKSLRSALTPPAIGLRAEPTAQHLGLGSTLPLAISVGLRRFAVYQDIRPHRRPGKSESFHQKSTRKLRRIRTSSCLYSLYSSPCTSCPQCCRCLRYRVSYR